VLGQARRYGGEMIVRPATVEDAPGIAEVHVRSWQGAYRGVLPQEFLDGLTVEPRVTAWHGIVADSDWPRSGVIVAAEDDVLLGFVHFSPTRDDDCDRATVGEVTTIYVRPDLFGQGVGGGLMSAALTALRDAEYVEAALWVLEHNARAIAFYTAGGWRPDGDRKDDEVAGVGVTEIRYRRGLRD
jgi:GNAT superfamily N-acetyltransferase